MFLQVEFLIQECASIRWLLLLDKAVPSSQSSPDIDYGSCIGLVGVQLIQAGLNGAGLLLSVGVRVICLSLCLSGSRGLLGTSSSHDDGGGTSTRHETSSG